MGWGGGDMGGGEGGGGRGGGLDNLRNENGRLLIAMDHFGIKPFFIRR
jgi:hypothetical protein